MTHAYTAIRWRSDDSDPPEVRLCESLEDAADWLFDFQGGEDEDTNEHREMLYSHQQVELDEGVNLLILHLTVMPRSR